MDPLRGEYGFLTEFSGITELEARERVRCMYDTFGILEFQFYDAFEGYSNPPEAHLEEWKNACKVHLGDAKPTVSRAILQAYLSEIRALGGRSWLYVQAMGCDPGDTELRKLPEAKNGYGDGPPQLAAISGSHVVNDRPLLDAVVVTEWWAKRFVPQWASFALSVGFSGIHWDTLGDHNQQQKTLGCDLPGFLRAALEILKPHGLAQTCNFVDGFGWASDLAQGVGWKSNIVAFPYWECWSPEREDAFFRLVGRKRNAVFVCYPGASEEHKGESQNCNVRGVWPLDVVILRWQKARAEGCTYLAVGDGCRHIQTEYFPSTRPIGKADVSKILAAVFENQPVKPSG
ncbi:unnamed protein product [Effrenium voratum]|nr:unnamed protein product [Effrenium voratum]